MSMLLDTNPTPILELHREAKTELHMIQMCLSDVLRSAVQSMPHPSRTPSLILHPLASIETQRLLEQPAFSLSRIYA
jgi:hypothetical protein